MKVASFIVEFEVKDLKVLSREKSLFLAMDAAHLVLTPRLAVFDTTYT
jgi:DNA-binding cell septation regulator SpoVG